jgi:hypothetical protein
MASTGRGGLPARLALLGLEARAVISDTWPHHKHMASSACPGTFLKRVRRQYGQRSFMAAAPRTRCLGTLRSLEHGVVAVALREQHGSLPNVAVGDHREIKARLALPSRFS